MSQSIKERVENYQCLRPEDLKNMFIGRTVYYVQAFRDTQTSFVSEYFVFGVTYRDSIGWFATTSSGFHDGGKSDERWSFSFDDCNVLPNSYNCHRLFRSQEEAEYYMEHPELWRPMKENNERLRAYELGVLDEFFGENGVLS